jgi:hypothetical protein
MGPPFMWGRSGRAYRDPGTCARSPSRRLGKPWPGLFSGLDPEPPGRGEQPSRQRGATSCTRVDEEDGGCRGQARDGGVWGRPQGLEREPQESPRHSAANGLSGEPGSRLRGSPLCSASRSGDARTFRRGDRDGGHAIGLRSCEVPAPGDLPEFGRSLPSAAEGERPAKKLVSAGVLAPSARAEPAGHPGLEPESPVLETGAFVGSVTLRTGKERCPPGNKGGSKGVSGRRREA